MGDVTTKNLRQDAQAIGERMQRAARKIAEGKKGVWAGEGVEGMRIV